MIGVYASLMSSVVKNRLSAQGWVLVSMFTFFMARLIFMSKR